MSIKTANVIVTFKNKTESEWEKDLTFVPLKGEIIIYNVDEKNSAPRIKIGDGITTLNNLPFISKTNEIEVKDENIFFKY